MLTDIRKFSRSWVMKILFGILIASFAVWGVDDMVRVVQSDSGAAVKVDDVEVGAGEVADQVRREINRLRPAFGGQFGVDEARNLGVVESVVQRIVNDTAILVAARNLGIAIGDDLVRDAVQKNPVFQGLGGFDRDRFRQVLNQNEMSEEWYLEQLRKQMARDQVLDSVSLTKAPNVLVDPIYRRRQEKRIAETVFIADGSQQGVPEPDAAALEAYHKAQAARFTAPEYRALTVIRLDAADLAKEIAVSDTQIRETYEARVEEYATPERRKVQQMIFSTEDDAKRAHALLSEGRAFAAVAKDVAKMEADVVELGNLTRAELLPELADAVFALGKNKPSAPVSSPLGWHVFQVTEITPGSKKTLDQARDDIRTTIAREKAVDGLFRLANKLDDLLAGGASLEEAARQLNIKQQKIAAIDAQGRGPDGKPITDVPKGEFLQIAFATEEGADSLLTETGRDGFFVLRVDGITSPALKPLARIKAEVTAAWKADRRADAAKKAAEAVVARLKGGAALDVVAKELGLAVTTTPPLPRAPGQENELPPGLVTGIFAVNQGETALARGKGGYHVARVKEIVPADPAADKVARDALAGTLKESFESDLLVQFAVALRDRYDTSINRSGIDNWIAGNVGGGPSRPIR